MPYKLLDLLFKGVSYILQRVIHRFCWLIMVHCTFMSFYLNIQQLILVLL